MARYVFRLPDVGEGIAEAELVAWQVEVGQVVEEDAPLAEVMTDKANVEIGAPVSGRIVERRGQVGEMIPIGSDFVVFETADPAPPAGEGDPKAGGGESHPPAAAVAPSSAAQAAPEGRGLPRGDRQDVGDRIETASAVSRSSPPSPIKMGEDQKRAQASPAVRRRAADLGIDLATVDGSGPDGRVLHSDLDALLSGGAAPGGEKVTGLRRRIAERMTQSGAIPQFGYVETIDVTDLEAVRARINAERCEGRDELGLLPFVLTAVVRAIREFPQMNAHYDGAAGLLRRHETVHLGIAAQTDQGLVVPVLREAQGRDLWDLSAEVARLAAAARSGKATREELSGSTITVTSLGRLGGLATSPLLNPPEVAILGPNRAEERAVVRDGKIVVRRMMNLSASFDHRVIDGYDAARFVAAIKAALEAPESLAIVEQGPAPPG